jgi:hypothetical protein
MADTGDTADRTTSELADARRELRDRLAAVSAFKAALAGKAASPGPRTLELDAEAGVLRALRHELETSLACLDGLESAVEEARRRVERAERAWSAARRARSQGLADGARE